MNLFELFFKIAVDDQASKQVSALSSKLGNGLKKSAKIGLAAVGTAAAGIAALTKQSVESYAKYEQLVGGAETLFKESANELIAAAGGAYKTAGLSANEYISTVTGFSASLLQSLEGDTKAAASLADQALVDMSDNANKMGTDMSLIQNAYQGFAKANYTMLDNLKLGYGGTKTEMRRLIKDAAKLDDSVDESSMSFDNIVKAIHAVQSEMGITGTTALEASTTIEGSARAAKAAWENLKVAMASGNGDIGKEIDAFVESAVTVWDNLEPTIANSLNGAALLIGNLGPKIVEALPGIVTSILPTLADAAINLVGSAGQMIVNSAPALLDSVFKLVENLLNAAYAALTDGQAIQKVIGLVSELAKKITSPDTLVPIVGAASDILMALTTGLVDAIPTLLTSIPAIIGNLVGALQGSVPTLLKTAIELVLTLSTALTSPESLLALAQGGVEMVFGIINGVKQAFLSVFNIGKEIFDNIKRGFTAFFEDPIKWGRDIIENIKKGISQKWDELVEWFSNLWGNLFSSPNNSVTVEASVKGEGESHESPNGSHWSGLSHVPFDGYLAELHEGERVLTKREAKKYRKGDGLAGATVNVTINGAKYNDEDQLAEAVARRLQRLIEEEEGVYA